PSPTAPAPAPDTAATSPSLRNRIIT
ncbi:hypothetical protein CSHISOI_07426, partial [Colletotrichum shisoi]